MSTIFYDLFVRHAVVRLPAGVRENLPQRDAKWPDVRLSSEFALEEEKEK